MKFQKREAWCSALSDIGKCWDINTVNFVAGLLHNEVPQVARIMPFRQLGRSSPYTVRSSPFPFWVTASYDRWQTVYHREGRKIQEAVTAWVTADINSDVWNHKPAIPSNLVSLEQSVLIIVISISTILMSKSAPLNDSWNPLYSSQH